MCSSGRCSYCQDERAAERLARENEDKALRAEFQAAINVQVANLSPEGRALWDAMGELKAAGLLTSDPRIQPRAARHPWEAVA